MMPHDSEIPNLKPKMNQTLKDLVFYATAIAAIGGWLWKAARNQVDASEMENVKTEMRSTLQKYGDRLAGVEVNTAVAAVKLDSVKESLVRIEEANAKHKR